MAFILSSEKNYGVRHIEQLADGIIIPSYKWFSLHNNILDGSLHPMDSTGVYQVGWWGESLSDEYGNVTNQVITINDVRSINALRIAGDSLLDEFPVNFSIQLFNSENLLYTEDVQDNNQVIWTKKLNSIYDVTSIK